MSLLEQDVATLKDKNNALEVETEAAKNEVLIYPPSSYPTLTITSSLILSYLHFSLQINDLLTRTDCSARDKDA